MALVALTLHLPFANRTLHLGSGTGWKAKGEAPVSPNHPSSTFPWIIFQVMVVALCGSGLLSGMCDLMMKLAQCRPNQGQV